MEYILLYLALYIGSVWWMQRDWRSHSDLDPGTAILVVLLSVFLLGWFLLALHGLTKLVDFLFQGRVIAKRYTIRVDRLK